MAMGRLADLGRKDKYRWTDGFAEGEPGALLA